MRLKQGEMRRGAGFDGVKVRGEGEGELMGAVPWKGPSTFEERR